MYNSNTESNSLILGVEVFFVGVIVQEHCALVCEIYGHCESSQRFVASSIGQYYIPVAGSQGCGKTLLIKSLAANAEPGSVTKHAASVPTTGQVSPSVPQIN